MLSRRYQHLTQMTILSQGIVYEETYEAEDQVIKNDGWYTNRREVRQEGAEGLRRVNDIVVSENGIEICLKFFCNDR